jgi:putative MATE family efflux protein
MKPSSALERSDTRVLLQLLVSLGGPIVVQNVIGSSLNMLDSVMIGSLGAAQIAGVAIANQIFFVLNLFVFGTGSGAGVFVAQYWGGRDMTGIRRSIGSGIMPRQLIALFSTDPAVIDAGARFLKVVSVGFLFQAVSGILIFVLRSMEKTRMPLIASSIALALNTVLNYVLIFGAFGVPAMGVEGSALATVIARLLELGLILVAIQGKHGVAGLFAAPHLREFFAIDRTFLRRFLVVILPVVGNEVGWSVGIALETAVFGRMSTDALAAFNIADTAIKLVIVVFFGVINSSAIVVGKRIGAGDVPGAVHAARVYTRVSPLLGAALGLVCVGLSLFVPSFFNVSGQARHWAMLGMIIYGAVMPLRMLNWVMVVGVLRAGGDTGVSMALDVGGTWLVGRWRPSRGCSSAPPSGWSTSAPSWRTCPSASSGSGACVPASG